MMAAQETIAVCFVCLGNICRSPTAEGVMIKLVTDAGLSDRIRIDSAGTGAYHVGERADARSRATALQRGITLESRARLFVAEDFERFDYLLAMDSKNLAHMERMARGDAQRKKLALLRSYDPQAKGRDVPDPYYEDNFDEVFDICEAGCRGLLTHIVQTHRLKP
jgi:protein-tyrosine phosphatase